MTYSDSSLVLSWYKHSPKGLCVYEKIQVTIKIDRQIDRQTDRQQINMVSLYQTKVPKTNKKKILLCCNSKPKILIKFFQIQVFQINFAINQVLLQQGNKHTCQRKIHQMLYHPLVPFQTVHLQAGTGHQGFEKLSRISIKLFHLVS